MSINWTGFENNIVSAIKNRRAKDESAFAKLIADEYDITIKNNAQDLLLGNKVFVTNKSILENALRNAFKLAKLSQSASEAQNIMMLFINTGVVGYWLGGKLGLTNPPPGAVSVVSNIITFPGVPPDVKISNVSKPEEFAKELTNRFKAHVLTISVVTTGISINGVPIVVPINGIN